jgi:AraC-like DNA-binding protein
MTIESSVTECRVRGLELTLDRSGSMLVPMGTTIAFHAKTVCRVAVIEFHERLFALVARAYKSLSLDRRALEEWLGAVEILPRTVWVHEIVHRYLFERHALGQHDNAATRFLETEILKEIYFLFRDRHAGNDRAPLVHRHSTCVERAVAYVESHLFEPCSLARLVAHAAASESTLTRAFRRELGCTPIAYWRTRKLDEALALLKGGNHSIAEVATRVGYENPTAFAFAFRLRFSRPPSSFSAPSRRLRKAPTL